MQKEQDATSGSSAYFRLSHERIISIRFVAGNITLAKALVKVFFNFKMAKWLSLSFALLIISNTLHFVFISRSYSQDNFQHALRIIDDSLDHDSYAG